jgi:hypothetical protein
MSGAAATAAAEAIGQAGKEGKEGIEDADADAVYEEVNLEDMEYDEIEEVCSAPFASACTSKRLSYRPI